MGLRTRLLRALGFKRQQGDVSRRRSYAAAVINRLTSDWVTQSTSADAEIKSSIKKLRDRSRQLVRDNAFARQAKRCVQLNVIGRGVKLQSQVMTARGNKQDTKINELIEAKWNNWCRLGNCDVTGKFSFHDLEWLASGALPESGEILFRIHRQSHGKSKIPLSLELIESDVLDSEYTGGVLEPGHEWRMGVETNQYGKPVRYALLTRHPGDYWFQGSKELAANRHELVPAEDIIHLFIPDRPLQSRGVTWFASVMTDVHQLDGYVSAAVTRARAAASLMGFIGSVDGEITSHEEVNDGERITDWSPGQFHYLNPNETITVPDLKSPDQQFDMFVKANVRRFASGFGCSYSSLSRDFSDTNYSSSRLSLLEDRDHWKWIQQYMIDHFHSRVFREWLSLAVLSGDLQLGDYELRPDRYDDPKWLVRGWNWVDPLKEAQAYAMMEDRGYMTKAQICAQLGTDLGDNIQQIAREKKMQEEAGLNLYSEVPPLEEESDS